MSQKSPNYGPTGTARPLAPLSRTSLEPHLLQKYLRFRSTRAGVLWVFYAVIMSLMFAAKISFTFPGGVKANLLPEEYFNFKRPLDSTLLVIHLATVLPAGLLAVFQFVPLMRHRFIRYHRFIGKVINLLTIISTLSACAIARVSFGGELSTQMATYVLGVMSFGSMLASWRAIRHQRLDEHRRWIIRSWSYQMSIVTMRVILIFSMLIIGSTGGHFVTISCAGVEDALNNSTRFALEYPQCLDGWSGRPVSHVAVEATLENDFTQMMGFRAAFGMSAWFALWIHAVIVEWYLVKKT